MIMALAFSMGAYADAKKMDIDNSVRRAFEMSVNQTKLSQALDMTPSQVEETDSIMKKFSVNMAYAAQISNRQASNRIVANAVKENLKSMRRALQYEQFKKYRMLLNVTMRNKGFDIPEICQ